MTRRGFRPEMLLIGLGLVACESIPTGPAYEVLMPQFYETVMGSDGHETLSFADASEVPADAHAEIDSIFASVTWAGFYAEGRTGVMWNGNRLSVTRELVVSPGGMKAGPGTVTDWRIWDWGTTILDPDKIDVLTLEKCGQVANMTVNATAKLMAMIASTASKQRWTGARGRTPL